MLHDGSAAYVYGHERLAAIAPDGTRTWYLGDALGSIRMRLDDAGIPLDAAAYTPFGIPHETMPAPFGFTGELHDAGLVYLRARWYNPGSGTFATRDPFAGYAERPYSLHPYQYAYSNPVVWTDPSGRVVGVATLGGAVLLGGASLATAALIAAPVLLVGSVYAFNPDAQRDLVRGATAAWTAPGASLAVVTGMSTAEEAFGPPHTGHQDVVPPDLHAHAPLPPFIPEAPGLPILGGPSEPVETVCPHHLGGTTLLSPSWQDFIFVNPLPEQQTATVVGVMPRSTRRLGDLQPLHKHGLNESTERQLRKMSDAELWETVFRPWKNEFITVHAGKNVVIDGNTRLYEMHRRMQENPTGPFNKDLEVPVYERSRGSLDPNLPADY